MHRRGLQHVSSTVSGSQVLTRCIHGSAAAPPYAAKSTPRPPPRKKGKATRPPPPKDRNVIGSVDIGRRSALEPAINSKDVLKAVDELIIASAKAKVSRNTVALEQNVQSIVPSQTKTQFFAEPAPEVAADFSVGEDLGSSRSIPVGTFIELRRNQATTHGVVLSSVSEGSRRTVWSITSSGEIFMTLVDDVMFAIPDFMDRNTVAACGDSSLLQEETHVPDANQIAARVRILKKLRSLEQEVETSYQTVAMRVAQALRSAPWYSSNEWHEVSTNEVVALAGLRGMVDKLCVHKYLMAHYERFTAHSSDFLGTQKFWVRPCTALEDLSLVTTLISQRSPVLDTFAEKARRLVAASRERRASSSNPAVRPDPETSFSSEEQAIIRVLIAFVRNTRTTQKDPYTIPVATIVKRVGLYNVKISSAVVHQFLSEIGAIAPWDDPVSRDRSLVTLPPRKDPLASLSNPVPSLSTLGPDDYYPNDMVAHLRHDFGDLPAFVIDDVGAQELDDAVSVEHIPSEPNNYWVHVHIADPTLKLHPLHALSQQARLKFSTAYDVHHTEPMIPSSVMYEGLSLGSQSEQGLPDNVLTFSAKIDERGEILEHRVRPGILRNVQVVRYDDVDRLLGLPPVDRTTPFSIPSSEERIDVPPSLPPTHIEDFRALHSIAHRLVRNRYERDGLWWDIPASTVVVTPKPLPPNPSDLSHPSIYTGYPDLTYVVNSQEKTERGARQLVAECMKVACRVASRFFIERDVPFVRRASSFPHVPGEGAWEALLAKRRDDGCLDIETIVKANITVPRGEYTLEPKGHYVLGVPDGEGYVRVTSPLRRYGDLVAHWQIKHALVAASGGQPKPLFDTTWLTEFAREMTTKEMALKAIERRHNQFWSFRYLQRWQATAQSDHGRPNPLDAMEAIVIREAETDIVFHRSNIRVIIPSLGVPAKLEVKDGRLLNLGEKILVRYNQIELGCRPEFGVSLCD
ncbi:hypothetical protein PHLGIDRAFT_109664 [Phlebiopsis gigantea 11061_1 CR5-6]|uniref:RNB domain-containing protein n=1 Tax=Phlebiopsis gigantea (strain 11061_1 CR5-6) TaxID=745531 RepID=A0A0C3PFM4_PHLG1|nr:hypothetical protein PHLGIDRAFT_109664 [Phlebiopsis gigantea 11061_1 CR5-6]